MATNFEFSSEESDEFPLGQVQRSVHPSLLHRLQPSPECSPKQSPAIRHTRQAVTQPQIRTLFYKDWTQPRLLKVLFDQAIPIPTGADREELFRLYCSSMSATPVFPPVKRKRNASQSRHPGLPIAVPIPPQLQALAGAPQEGAAGYEEGGGRGTTCPRSFFAAGRDQHAVGRATTGRGKNHWRRLNLELKKKLIKKILSFSLAGFQVIALADAAEENQAALCQEFTRFRRATHLIILLIELWQNLSRDQTVILEATFLPLLQDTPQMVKYLNFYFGSD
ncbi:UNVERIFIED_CONTAM: hypothetical protein FKN15_006812 [Acipenser sinensis]